jgi:uncharacterized protein (TIGR02246 family)
MLKRSLFAVLLVLAPLAAQARQQACQPIDVKGVEALFTRWNAALASRDPDKVAATYAPDATLLPTVETGPLTTPQQIRGYFVHFLEQSPQGRIDRRVIRIGCNLAWDIGLYTFVLHQPDGTTRTLHARYTFIYAPVGRGWLIVHQHSSADPAAPVR